MQILPSGEKFGSENVVTLPVLTLYRLCGKARLLTAARRDLVHVKIDAVEHIKLFRLIGYHVKTEGGIVGIIANAVPNHSRILRRCRNVQPLFGIGCRSAHGDTPFRLLDPIFILPTLLRQLAVNLHVGIHFPNERLVVCPLIFVAVLHNVIFLRAAAGNRRNQGGNKGATCKRQQNCSLYLFHDFPLLITSREPRYRKF